MPIRVVNYCPAEFRTRLSVKVGEAYERDAVLAAVEAAFRDQFTFDRRDFGQGITLDEVAAVAQGVGGVEAAHVVSLYLSGAPPARVPRLTAALPVVSLTEAPVPAELLTLSDAPLELGAMP
jgi:hypothetical protein